MKYIQQLFNNLTSSFGDTLPSVIGALLILIIGLWLAKKIKKVLEKGLNKANLSKKIDKDGSLNLNLESILASFIYYLLVILVLIVVLGLLGVNDVLQPIKDMLSGFLGFIPNLIAGGIIGYAGYLIAKIVSDMISSLAGKLDSVKSKIGLADDFDLAKLVKQLVFIVIFIPILIAALNALKIDAISKPATAMLASVMDSIPSILAASAILMVFFIIAKLVSTALKGLFESLNFDEFPAKIGLEKVMSGTSISSVASKVIFFYICFFGLITAFEKLGFIKIVDLLNDLLTLSGKIFFGLIIMTVGFFLSNLAHKALSNTENGLASIARIAILGLFFAMSLNSMGFAEDIVNLSFALILGSIAVAIALSFGLGGREAAGKQMQKIIDKFNTKK